MNTQYLANSWLVSFGHSKPPEDVRRLIVVAPEPEIKKQRKPAGRSSKMTVKSKEGKKLRRGIYAMLRAGFDKHEEIYDYLLLRGFVNAKAKRNDNGIAHREFMCYLNDARVYLVIPKKTKRYLVIELCKAGKDVGEIRKELNVPRSYIRTILIEAGLIEKMPRCGQKNIPPAWSKCGIK